jgi:hypothetical protein
VMTEKGGVGGTRRGSSRVSSGIVPRLALWAGVGVFMFVLAIIVSCGDDGVGPSGPPNPNDPHPIWVFYGTWYKYDQLGNEILRVKTEPYAGGYALNPSTGDIWGEDPHTSTWYIFDSKGYLVKRVGKFENVDGLAFDTKVKRVWMPSRPAGTEIFYLKKFNYEGELLRNVAMDAEVINVHDIDVYEETGDVWVMSSYSASRYHILKYDKNGNLLLKKTELQVRYETPWSGLFVDQTDGGVWIFRDRYYPCKYDKNCNRVLMLNRLGYILDVGRRTGDVLMKVWQSDGSRMMLLNKNGGVVWRTEIEKRYDSKGFIADFDGSSWYCRREGTPTYVIGKINRAGEYVVKDVPIVAESFYFNMLLKTDPYPYR